MARPHRHLPQLLELHLLAFVLNVAQPPELSDNLDSVLPSLAASFSLAVSGMHFKTICRARRRGLSGMPPQA